MSGAPEEGGCPTQSRPSCHPTICLSPSELPPPILCPRPISMGMLPTLSFREWRQNPGRGGMPPGAQVITENPQPGSGQEVGGAFTQQVCPVARKGRKLPPPSCHCMTIRAKPDAQKGAAERGFVPQKPAQVQHLRSYPSHGPPSS